MEVKKLQEITVKLDHGHFAGLYVDGVLQENVHAVIMKCNEQGVTFWTKHREVYLKQPESRLCDIGSDIGYNADGS